MTPYTVTYDGAAHTATGTATGVEAAPADLSALLDLSGTTHTTAGTYATRCVDLHGRRGNYNNTSGTVNDSIAKAERDDRGDALHRDLQRQRRTPRPARPPAWRPTAANLSGLLDLNGTTHTNAGSYATDAWTFTGNGNYNNANGTVNDSIAKAERDDRVTPYSRDLQRHGAHRDRHGHRRGGPTGEPGEPARLERHDAHQRRLATRRDAWTFTGDGNYNNTSGTVNDSIAKANAVIMVTPYSVTYNGNGAHGDRHGHGRRDPTPANLASLLDLSGTTHTNAGSYATDAWTFTGNSNYNATERHVQRQHRQGGRGDRRDALQRDLQRRGAHRDRHSERGGNPDAGEPEPARLDRHDAH